MTGGCLLAAVLAVGAYASNALLTGNFGTVVPGEVYRSAQLGNGLMTRVVQRYGIKTIINLRGANPGEHWYDKELADAKALGVAHIDFSMSAKHELTQARAQQLIELMAKAPKPLLIHCNSGSDRTGLASALYVASIAKQGEDAAEGQLSLRFGHVSLPFVPEYAMDQTWESLEPWLGFGDS
ncbi:dual specificity protein phosphatase family protein [Labrys miyagiensis]|uniref:dual specificity protein phosphatase family protein n=1 Tax=Labrys miyagiensis TaxID=346912 RepID=UPI0024E09D01|nr:dual specificity protein phosphatase family protein [Labrys miyagiensis]